ncbi:hypothetical protein D9613_008332 [Agrocybe pediades]|uniref:Uncharacterized protein n=1 Tax=Agrocybe pediades TaxID=84607 RepID=A0A8H4QSB1_9AGAR|nr:hypothetical protein D9613_008332 [Agrocybe pediades]KAF9547470.1 hypothetical protein CPC08DRAFT_755460 [Agrocybe pediades]
MEGCPEPLEKIFQQLEKESELRAEEERVYTMAQPGLPSIKRIKERRRGSVSISRIGQVPEEDVVSENHVPLTPTAMTIAAKSSFYQAQLANTSTASVASGASAFSDDLAHTEDNHTVTQMQHIAGKPSILPRRLSRSHSTNIIPTSNIEPIGVSVQHATVQTVRHVTDGPVTRSRQGSVTAGSNTIRHQSSRATMPKPNPPSNATSWLAKAKDFTLKFRRKNNRHSVSGQHLYA